MKSGLIRLRSTLQIEAILGTLAAGVAKAKSSKKLDKKPDEKEGKLATIDTIALIVTENITVLSGPGLADTWNELRPLLDDAAKPEAKPAHVEPPKV